MPLNRSESLAFFELAPTPLWMVGADGRVRAANPAARASLGAADGEFIPFALFEIVHAADRDTLEEALQKAKSRHLDVEIRMRRANESYVALRIFGSWCAEADAYLLVSEEAGRRRQEHLLFERVFKKTSAQTGESFYDSLVAVLAAELDCDHVFLGRLTDAATRVKCLAFHSDHSSGQCPLMPSYALDGTPCEKTLVQGFCHLPSGSAELFPDDTYLKELGVEAFVGQPIHDSRRRPIGILGLMYKRPVAESPELRPVLELIAARIGAEIERVERETALAENEARYRLLAENTSDIIAKHALDGTYTFVSPANKAIVGLEPHEMIGRSPFEFIHPEDAETVRVAEEKLLTSGEPVTMIFRARKSDGDYVWLESVARVLTDPATGKPAELVSVSREISERKKNEELLRRNQQFLQAILDHTPAVFYAKDTEGRFLFINDEFESLHRVTRDEIIGKTDFDLFPRPMADSVRENDQKVLTTGRTTQIEELAFHRASIRHFLTVRFPLFDAEGRPNAVCAISTDITTQKRAEEELRRQQQRQLLHVQQTPLGAVEFNTRGEIIEWNPAAEKVFGFRKHEVLGKHWHSLLANPSSSKDLDMLWNLLLSQRGGHRSSLQNRTKDGRIIHCEWYNTALVDLDGTTVGVATLIQDVTDKKRTEALLEEQRLRIIAASKMSSLGEMASGIAHEINNPLAIILGKTEQLERNIRRGAKDPEVLIQDLDKISATVQRIAKIIRGLRSFARDGDRDPFETRAVATLVQDTLEFCQSRFRHHNVDFRVTEIPAELSLQCRPVQISQVLLNLLNNAFDAVEHQPGSWVELSVHDKDERLEFWVTDSGPGIPDPIATKIMQPFFTTKDLGKGTGLGLSISKGIVEAHTGRLELDRSCANTRFRISLPKRQPARRPIIARAPAITPSELN